MSKSVGGHYGGIQEQGASDMADIARSTFAINKMYNRLCAEFGEDKAKEFIAVIREEKHDKNNI